jgi:energy-converting hydrogenase Eha subunit E
MQKFLQVEVVAWGVSRIFGDFGPASLAHLSFFASTTAVVMLRARCASAAHPLEWS